MLHPQQKKYRVSWTSLRAKVSSCQHLDNSVKKAAFSPFPQDMAAICDLPIEMRLEILEKLSLHELVVNSSMTCHQWRDDIAQHIMAPKILALAEVNEKFKMDIKEKGWAEEANNPTELLMSLYNKYEHFTSKYFFC